MGEYNSTDIYRIPKARAGVATRASALVMNSKLRNYILYTE